MRPPRKYYRALHEFADKTQKVAETRCLLSFCEAWKAQFGEQFVRMAQETVRTAMNEQREAQSQLTKTVISLIQDASESHE